MSTDRTLQEIAARLDDLSLALEEVKGRVEDNATPDPEQLEQLQNEIEEATELIEAAVDPASPGSATDRS